MGRITLELDDDVEVLLRQYVGRMYLRTHGKLTAVIQEAIKDYCSRVSLEAHIRSQRPGDHFLLLHEDWDSSRHLELQFIATNISKGTPVVEVVQGDDEETPDVVKREMLDAGMSTVLGGLDELFHIARVSPEADAGELERQVVGLVKECRAAKSACALLLHSDRKTEATQWWRRRIALEKSIHAAKNGALITTCNYPVRPETKEMADIISELVSLHGAALFTLMSRNFILGQGANPEG